MARNLVVDGGFEISVGDDFTYWTEVTGGTATITADTTNQRSGSQCVKFHPDATNSCYVSQDIGCEIGQRYTISFWAKGDSTDARMYCSRPFNTGTIALTTKWTYYSFTGTADNTEIIVSRLSAVPDDDFYVDDLRVEPVPAKVAFVRGALAEDLSPSGVDFTESGFGTPKAALVFVSNACVENNPRENAAVSMGFWDGTNMLCAYGGIRGYIDISDANRGYKTGRVAVIRVTATNSCEYVINNITDGVRITLVPGTDNTSLQRIATVILLNGHDVKSAVSDFTPATTINERATETGLPFSPTLIFWTGAGVGVDTETNIHIWSFGASTRHGVMKNSSIMCFEADALDVSRNGSYSSNTMCAGQFYADVLDWGARVEAFTGDGFILKTVNEGTSSDHIGYLALDLGPGMNARLHDFTTKTSTGVQQFRDFGFTPSHLLLCVTKATSYNTPIQGYSINVGVDDMSTKSSIAIFSQDAVDYANAASLSQLRPLDLRDESTSGVFMAATVTSFMDNGYDLTYTTADGTARYGFGVAFQTEEDQRIVKTTDDLFWLL